MHMLKFVYFTRVLFSTRFPCLDLMIDLLGVDNSTLTLNTLIDQVTPRDQDNDQDNDDDVDFEEEVRQIDAVHDGIETFEILECVLFDSVS